MNYWNNLLIEGGTGADAGLRAYNATDIGVWMLLFLVRALPLSSSLPSGRGLQQGL